MDVDNAAEAKQLADHMQRHPLYTELQRRKALLRQTELDFYSLLYDIAPKCTARLGGFLDVRAAVTDIFPGEFGTLTYALLIRGGDYIFPYQHAEWEIAYEPVHHVTLDGSE